jgi:1,2-diacylglycerol 3-alpha-glucosyltransferase
MSIQFCLLLIWDNYADYHYSRLIAARNCPTQKWWRVIGGELVGKSASHAWASKQSGRPEIVRLQSFAPKGVVQWVGFLARLLLMQYRIKPDVVFVPSYWPLRSAMTLLVTRLLGGSAVMMNDSHAGTVRASGLGALCKLLLIKLFSAAFVAGRPQVRYFEQLGIPRAALFTGYDTIDGRCFAAAARDDHFLAERHSRYRAPMSPILSLGRLIPKKNIATLIRAYAAVCNKMGADTPALVIVGEGEDRSVIGQLSAEFSLDVLLFTGSEDYTDKRRCICLYPFCSNGDAAYYYERASVFVLASLYEEWGLVVNEAVACGTPVLVSNQAGCAEDLVIPGVNGFQFSPQDVSELAQKLYALVQDHELNTRLRAGAEQMLSCVEIEQFPKGLFAAARYALRFEAGRPVV